MLRATYIEARMVIVVAMVALLASSESFACDTKAPLPKLGDPFDWSKYSGTWYQTITTFDPVNLNRECVVLERLSSVMSEDGNDALYIYRNGLRRKQQWRLVDVGDGYFRHVDSTHDEVIADSLDENGNFNLESAVESEEIKHNLLTYLGDYQHYMACIRCTPKGWNIQIFTDVKSVSTELLLRIHNDLLKYNVSVPLRLSRCAHVKDI